MRRITRLEDKNMDSVTHKNYTKQELNDLNGLSSNRHGFIFPFMLKEITEEMTAAEAGLLLRAILLYVEQNVVLDINNKSLPYFALKQFISQYDKDAEKYLDKVTQLRQSGSKGGKSGRANTNEANA